MMFVEVFVPKHSLRSEQRRRLGERIVAEVMTEESAPPSVIEAGQALTQVVVHEPDTWIVGNQSVDAADAPRYLVRVSVPAAWRKEMSAEVISRIARVLAGADEDPDRLYRDPVAWVHVAGVPEGSYGTQGRALRSPDLIHMLTAAWRASPEAGRATAEQPPGTAIDPVCGMTAPLTDDALTLERDDTVYAFCSAGCRQFFAQEQRG